MNQNTVGSAPAAISPATKRTRFYGNTTVLPVSTSPCSVAKASFLTGCQELQFLDPKQSDKLSKKFVDLHDSLERAIISAKKFDDVYFVPKPLQINPSLLLHACNSERPPPSRTFKLRRA